MLAKVLGLFEEKAFAVAAFSIFGLLFAMRPVTWLPTVIILLCGILAVQSTFRKKLIGLSNKDGLWLIAIAFVTWFSVCLYIGLWHWGLAKSAFPENPFRIFLTIGLLALAIPSVSKKFFIAGLLVASVCVVLDVAYGYMVFDKYYPRISGTTNHPIHFGNFAALLGVLLASVALLGKAYKTSVRMLCLCGVVMALVATASSQSRSSFGLLLCLLPLFFVAQTDMMHRWLVRAGYALALVVVSVVATSPSIQESLRIKEAVVDVARIQARDYEGSIGSRFSMWQTAWSMFKEHPVVGIGPHKFKDEFARRMQSGETPKADAEHNQPHNDILNAAATGGVLKLMAYLFLIAGPFVFFYKEYKVKKFDLDRRMFPIMGMQVVVAFFITGLTNSNFDLEIYSTAYAVLVCVLARLSLYEINATEPSKLSVQAAQNY